MTTNDIPYLIAFCALFLATFGGIQFAQTRFGLPAEYTRRFAHVVSGLLTLLNHAFLSPTAFVVMVLGGGAAILTTRLLGIGAAVHDVERRTYGDSVLAIGYLAAYAISALHPAVFIPAVLVITLADPFAGLTGNLLKSPTKTWFGTGVFAVVTLVVLLTSSAAPPLAAASIAVVLALVERFSMLGFDNLTVPVATAVLLLAF
jgi:dolichol kinase